MNNDKYPSSRRGVFAVPQQQAIEVYVTEAGFVALCFTDHEARADREVIVDPRFIDDLCRALQEAKLSASLPRSPAESQRTR